MFIESNTINCSYESDYFHHDAKILYGKPKGTYFFRENLNLRAKQLIASAGGTRIVILTLKEDKGEISIKQKIAGKVNKLVFNCESEFVNYIRSHKLAFPSFPKFLRLGETIIEYNRNVRPLQYYAALSILRNTPLREKVFDLDSNLLPERLDDYLLEVALQLDAMRITFE